mmetsp:Transcript_6887/g.19289  ORF Transcript_6887/g.19289 Transcript_6887/m.19289 type:complete len:147 (-) Transcript_6887:791-1231(-)
MFHEVAAAAAAAVAAPRFRVAAYLCSLRFGVVLLVVCMAATVAGRFCLFVGWFVSARSWRAITMLISVGDDDDDLGDPFSLSSFEENHSNGPLPRVKFWEMCVRQRLGVINFWGRNSQNSRWGCHCLKTSGPEGDALDPPARAVRI